jgi:hypothetical protein
MPGPSPFTDDWRDCLRVHYQQVVRNQDHVTERTLVGVLHEVGFGDSEMAELKVLATVRADEMPADFVPDFEILQAQALEEIQQQAAIAEAEQAAEPRIFEAVAAEAPAASADDDSSALPPDEEPPDYKPDAPQQLSLF